MGGATDPVPPPVIVGYVEPAVAVYENTLAWLNLIEASIEQQHLSDDFFKENTKKVRALGQKLIAISKKELAGKSLNCEEYKFIEQFGGIVDYITQGLLQMQWFGVGTDTSIAVVADVFTQGEEEKCLQVGVGYADEIYVPVYIEGELYLTRGAVFRYYEFKQPLSNRLTNGQWHKLLAQRKVPPLEKWQEALYGPPLPMRTTMPLGGYSERIESSKVHNNVDKEAEFGNLLQELGKSPR
jgi:hypothetical protein